MDAHDGNFDQNLNSTKENKIIIIAHGFFYVTKTHCHL
jgi:hypothetical protein